MNLNANDLLVMHLNVNRTVGNETVNFSYFRDNSIDVIKSIKKLIENDVLKIENSLETSLPKLKVPELKEILRNNGLKVGGNKPELINRITDNLKQLDTSSLNLPSIYIPTEKGKELIKQTDYINHFFKDFTISLPRAHKLAVNNLNSTDKIETIYMHEIKYEMEINHDNHRLSRLFSSLAIYYLKNKSDKELARMYFNLSYYTGVYSHSNILSSNFENYSNLTDRVSYYILDPDFQMEDFYEQLIFIENTNVETLENLFISDIENFYDINHELARFLINYIVAKIKKDTNDVKHYGLRIFDFFDDTNTNTNDTEEINHDYSLPNFIGSNYDNLEEEKSTKQKNKSQNVKGTGAGCLSLIAILITGIFILIN